MDRLGLSSADLRAYHLALRNHTVLRRIRISVHDMDDRTLAHLTPDVIDGQIVVDRRTTPSRILNASFVDPAGVVNFDAQAPAATGLHYTRQLRVAVDTYVPELEEWVGGAVPFYGPVRAFDRDGDVVRVTCHGRDALGMGQLWTPFSQPRRTLKTSVIRRLLARYGETRLSIPNLPARLPAALNLGREPSPWPQARKLAGSMNRQLFYTGRGVATLRAWPGRSVFAFDDYLTSKVRANRSAEGVVNLVEVLGRKPRGAKSRVRAVAALRPGRGNMAAADLAPGDGRVFLTETIVNDHFRSTRECQAYADRRLADKSRQLVAIAFDCLPIYHLDEGDMATVEGRHFRLDQFTLPLHAGEGEGPPMTVGYIKRTTKA